MTATFIALITETQISKGAVRTETLRAFDAEAARAILQSLPSS